MGKDVSLKLLKGRSNFCPKLDSAILEKIMQTNSQYIVK